MLTSPENIQIVWDAGSECTAQAAAGQFLHVCPEGDWSPEQLLLAAAESSLLVAFTRLAKERGLEVLGYVSSAGITRSPRRGHVRIVVRPCVAIAQAADESLVHELLGRARETAPVARALGHSLRVAPEVVLLPPEGAVERAP